MKYKAIVIGTSAGGLNALSEILPMFPKNFPVPIIIVQHLASNDDGFLVEYLNKRSQIEVLEACDKQTIEPATAFIAPGGYHLLIENDLTLSLSSDEKVNYSRPSIDVLFESAADAYTESLIGVVLTGANNDGANGLNRIKSKGGLAIVQNPVNALSGYMPSAAIKETNVDYVMELNEIAKLLCDLVIENKNY